MENSSDYFCFKRFKVKNIHSAMRVNTDGVLLGAWMTIKADDRRLLDIGTGSGVIALMAAQRVHNIVKAKPDMFAMKIDRQTVNIDDIVKIEGVELDVGSAEEARYNFKNSPWPDTLSLYSCSFQDFLLRNDTEPGSYDLIFTNPPYFEDALKAPDHRKSQARHTDSLPYETIIAGSLELLSPIGRLALILPVHEAEKFITLARFAGLNLDRLCKVSSSKNKPPKRYLMEFSKEHSLPTEQTELVLQEGKEYTNEYRQLTKDFYLDF